MKFSTRQDIEAPIDFVFQRASDFVGFERQAMRRGIDIERDDSRAEKGVGMRWNAGFSFRGKQRRVQAELTEYDAPNILLIQSVSGGIEADFEIEFMPLSRNRTRVKVGLQLAPKTLSSRLLIQSLKFAKNNLNGRFGARIEQFGSDVEDKFDRSAGVRV